MIIRSYVTTIKIGEKEWESVQVVLSRRVTTGTLNWIIGYKDIRDDAHEARLLREQAPPGGDEWTSEGLYVAAGGRRATFFQRPSEGDSQVKGWVVVGLGMEIRDGSLCPLRKDDWDGRMTAQCPDLTKLDGHFCAVRWANGTLDFFNDALGLRTIFIAHRPSGTLFSTNLEWLARALGNPVLDYEAVGAQWFGRGELGASTALKGVVRLAQGASATISEGHLVLQDRPFATIQGSGESVDEILSAIASPSFGNGYTASLACSGGLDSRVQLAAMLRADVPMRLHSYGPDDHPDVRLCLEIGRITGLPVDRIPDSSNATLTEVQRYARSVHAYAPASTVVDWLHYAGLHRESTIVIDASLGEAGRCFFYRNLRVGEGATKLRGRAGVDVARIQRQPRPEVFSRSIRSVMLSGHLKAVQNVVDGLPDREAADDLADLLMLRLEGPRYAGYAASHVDDLTTGYFPFAQPTLLRSLLEMSPARRRSGRYYRTYIRKFAPELAVLPLVRNGPSVVTAPFGLSGRSARTFTLAMRLMGKAWHDERAVHFLHSLKESIRDLATSSATRQFEAYDSAALELLVEGYFEGRHDDAAGLDRWLSFELWRLGLTGVVF